MFDFEQLEAPLNFKSALLAYIDTSDDTNRERLEHAIKLIILHHEVLAATRHLVRDYKERLRTEDLWIVDALRVKLDEFLDDSNRKRLERLFAEAVAEIMPKEVRNEA